jgi:hypothetical protein
MSSLQMLSYTGFRLVIGFIGHFNTLLCYVHTHVLGHGLYQSSGNGFQRRTFPFLCAPELSPRPSATAYLN